MIYNEALIDAFSSQIQMLTPVQWAETYRILTSDIAGDKAGKMSYDYTPYLRHVANFVMPSRKAKYLFIEKGSQLGFSIGGIFTQMGWVMSESPGNMLFITENDDKIKEQMQNQIGQMIDCSGLADKVGSHNIREREAKGRRNTSTGDTLKGIKFNGGNFYTFSGQKIGGLSSWSIKYGFYDEVERWKGNYKKAGSFLGLVEPRHKFYEKTKKLTFLTTPEILQTSNIHPLYLSGDQQSYTIPCKHCGENIELRFTTKASNGDRAGMIYQRDKNGRYIKGTAEYMCQECGGTFKEKHKFNMYEEENTAYRKNKNGQHSETICYWRANAIPESEEYESMRISSLYSPLGFDAFEVMCKMWCEIHPPNGNPNIPKLQAFVNQYLGEPYKQRDKELNSKNLSNNCRWYDQKVVPNKTSKEDGNGDIVLLTCAVDLNGIMGENIKEDDVRLDYEVVGWSQRGDEYVTSYSIDHGSFGTFKRSKQRDKDEKKGLNEDREKWTYRYGYPNSVWKKFEDEVLNREWIKEDGTRMKIGLCGIDTGNYTTYANGFVSKHKVCIALKGDSKEKTTFGDKSTFKIGSKPGLYIVAGDRLKDKLAEQMALTWNPGDGVLQEEGFMNFPKRSQDKYNYQVYFVEYEGEVKRVYKDLQGNPINYHWEKKSSDARQHFLDCRIYNDVVKDIAIYLVCKEKKVQHTWENYGKLFGFMPLKIVNE